MDILEKSTNVAMEYSQQVNPAMRKKNFRKQNPRSWSSGRIWFKQVGTP